jgi:sugar phosphate isomerase/epimerase
MKRRDCIKTLGIAGIGLNTVPLWANKKASSSFDQGIHLFSKHLQWLDYQKAAEAAKMMGFDGLDITVRPKGHVLPENVERDLPKFVDAIRKAGLKADLITTAVTDAENQYTEKIIKTASDLGIQYYRMGWLKYSDDQPIDEQIERYKKQFETLAQLNEQYNIHGAYQNHSGDSVGSAVWDIWMLVKDLNPDYLGCRFDVRHAMAEGLKSWKVGLRLLQTHIRSLDLTDFIYARKNDSWEIENVPVGDGAVDFEDYFKTLNELEINAPFTLHAEYDLGSANKGKSKISLPRKTVLNALRADLNYLKTAITKN